MSEASAGLGRSFFLSPYGLEPIIPVLGLKGVTGVLCPAQCLEYGRSSVTAIATFFLSPQNEVAIHVNGCVEPLNSPETQHARDSARDSHWS